MNSMYSIFLVGLLLQFACGTSGSAPVRRPQSPGTASLPNQVLIPIPMGATGKGTIAYGVNPLVVPRGSTVAWTNQDSMPHTATSATGVWDSGVLKLGESFSVKLETPGTYPYFCTLHGFASMSGTIQVE